MTGYTTVIGLEVHVQLGTESKLFSPAPVEALGQPNTRVHHVDIGLPGVLPRPNRRAIQLATRAALALGSEVQLYSEFARKHYFYPDLPKGYQISQFDLPLALGGSVGIGADRACRLHRLHVEEAECFPAPSDSRCICQHLGCFSEKTRRLLGED